VDTLTGAGVKEALAGAQVVVDVSNSPSFEDAAVLDFFLTSGRTLLAAEEAEGVRHHVAVSIVGADRLPDSGYLRAKVAQEQLISAGSVPYTIVRATQFFEFLRGIADAATVDGTVHATPAHFQPMAAQDVADIVSEVALGEPAGIVEIAGPEAIGLDELIRARLAAAGDPRPVVTDPESRYFGARLDDSSLTPAGPVRLGPTTYADWLRTNG
jgi:uncharacterized protein YbjT (DUF2867 family)